MTGDPDGRLKWEIWILLLACIGFIVGCRTGYTRTMRDVRQAMAEGQHERALQLVNEKLNVTSSRDAPPSLEGNQVIYLMERAVILQALEKYQRSARDLMAADERLEFLDLSSSDSLELGKYLYSERATTYRAPAYERLSLNSLNMMNFLAQGDYEKARVEARRFTVLEDFFERDDDRPVHYNLLALGNYLGGVAFERGGDFREAARYYGRSYYFGFQTEQLKNRITDLFRLTGYTPGELRKNNPDALRDLTDAAETGSISADSYRDTYLYGGDTLIVIQAGMVPFRDTERVPVNQAIEIAHGSRYSSHRLSTGQANRFRAVTVRTGIEAVPFPGLTRGNIPVQRNTKLRFEARSGTDLTSFPRVNLGRQVEQFWQRRRGALMVAAITRFIVRLTAAGVAKHQVQQHTESTGLGILAGLATYVALQQLDQPDTRSWVTLPGDIQLYRTRLSAGSRRITVEVGKRSVRKEISVSKPELNLVNFSSVR